MKLPPIIPKGGSCQRDICTKLNALWKKVWAEANIVNWERNEEKGVWSSVRKLGPRSLLTARLRTLQFSILGTKCRCLQDHAVHLTGGLFAKSLIQVRFFCLFKIESFCKFIQEQHIALTPSSPLSSVKLHQEIQGLARGPQRVKIKRQAACRVEETNVKNICSSAGPRWIPKSG